MYNTITSIMMVGGFIAISFVVIDIINNLNLLNPFVNLTNYALTPFGLNCGDAIINGILEITRGCLDLSTYNLNPKILSIMCSGLISFGGFSVHLQSLVFLSDCKIKYRYFLLTKITHAILTMCVCALICLIVF